MEPLLISSTSKHRARLSGLAVELSAHSAGFRRSLPEGILGALSDFGPINELLLQQSDRRSRHPPYRIERALKEDYSSDAKKRSLQLEARAHITVQKWIDKGGLKERATSKEGILEIHRRLCERLPEELLWVENLKTGERLKVIVGVFRLLSPARQALSPLKSRAICARPASFFHMRLEPDLWIRVVVEQVAYSAST